MKAKFNYGDVDEDFVILDVPKEYLYIEKLMRICCDSEFEEEEENDKIYWEVYDSFIQDVTEFFCKSVGSEINAGLTAEIGVPTGEYELEFDIVQQPYVENNEILYL